MNNSTILRVSERLREEASERHDVEILDLYLQCYTQEEITEKLGLTQQTISNRLINNGKLSKICIPDNLDIYNVWNTGRLSPDHIND